jgi:hypothetical protein
MDSTSNSTIKHKFFTRDLNNDLDTLSKELLLRYEKIKSAEMFGIMPIVDHEMWKESNSVSTMKWREYNVFQFHIDSVYNLFENVSEMTREACDWYKIDFKKSKYMVQGWFNINYSNSGKLDWHKHQPDGAPLFHGYYAVNAEPSITKYIIFDQEVEVNNINNRAILSETGHSHAMKEWDWEGPRITIAYDVRPLEKLQKSFMHQEQHWVPLL